MMSDKGTTSTLFLIQMLIFIRRRTKPLKSTQELMTQAAEHRAELERLEQERLYQEKLDLEQQLLQERLKDIEKCVYP